MISSLAWSFLSCLPSAGTPSTPAEYLLFSMPAPHLRFTHTKGMAATASAFLYPAISGIPAFPGMSITNQFDGLARGKSGGQLVTRLHTNYRCKSHLIENNLK